MLSKMYPGKNETTGEVEPIKVYTFAANNKIIDTIYLTNSSLGPFENSTADIKKQLYDVQIMSFNFNLHQYINPYAGAEGTCYIEAITQRFDFSKRGVVQVSLDNDRTTCDTIAYWNRDHPGEPIPQHGKLYHRLDDVMYWLYVIVILMACI